MKIIEFIDLENQKNCHLDNYNKANALLKSVNVELRKNINSNVPFGIDINLGYCNIPKQSEYSLGLRVTRYIIHSYLKDGLTIRSNIRNINYPNSPKDKKRLETIKEHLQLIFS
jgi:hypothetical protein